MPDDSAISRVQLQLIDIEQAAIRVKHDELMRALPPMPKKKSTSAEIAAFFSE